MKVELLFLCAVLVICLVAAAKKKKSSTSTKSETASSTSVNKFDSVIKAIKTGGSLISLTDRNFSKFITDRPRDYYAVLVLTATDPRYGCSVCVKGKNNLEDVAKLYNSQYNLSAVDTNQRVVFFKAEVDDARNIFTELRVETVPRTFILPPADVKAKKVPIQEHEVEGRGFLENLQASVDTVNNATGVKVKLRNFCLNLYFIFNF